MTSANATPITPQVDHFFPGQSNRRPTLAVKLDPDTLARRVLSDARSPNSPIIAKLLLHHHIDGRVLASSNEEDIIASLTTNIEDLKLENELRETLQRVSKTIRPVSPTPPSPRRIVSVREIEQRFFESINNSSAINPEGPLSPTETTSSWDLDSELPELESPQRPSSPDDVMESPVAGKPPSCCEITLSDSESDTPISPIFLHLHNDESDEDHLSPATPLHNQPAEPDTASSILPPIAIACPSSDDLTTEHPTLNLVPPAPVPSVQSTEPCALAHGLGIASEELSILMELPDADFVTMFPVLLNRMTGDTFTTGAGQASHRPSLSLPERSLLLRFVGLAEEGIASRHQSVSTQTDEEEIALPGPSSLTQPGSPQG